MVDFDRTWIFDENYVVAGADFNEQVRYQWFRMHQIITGAVGVDEDGNASAAGAWTLEDASDGAGNVGPGNIVDVSDFVIDAAGNNHTWLQWSAPASLITGRTPRLVLDLADGTDPRANALLVMMPGAPTTPGTATARPSHTDEVVAFPSTWFPNTTFVPRHVQGWRSSIGELIIAFCRDGLGYPETGIWLPRFDGGEAGCVWPMNLYALAQTANRGAFDGVAFETSSSWVGFWQDDTPLAATRVMRNAMGAAASSWALGRSNITGNIIAAPPTMTWNSATEGGYPGRIVDVRVCGNGVPDNETPIGDADPLVYATMGELAVPWRAAAGAMIV